MSNIFKYQTFFLVFWNILSHPAQSPDENKIKNYFCPPEIETLNISNWQNPTFDDYLLIQDHLKNKLLKILANPPHAKCFDPDLEGWITYRLGRIKLVDTRENPPKFEIVYINNNPHKKDKCVICYASYNCGGRDYTKGINYIIKSLKTFNFDGHFIYRIGGWPNLTKNRLKYADVPYGFKPFFFEEARDLGYKKILWIDAASMPVKSLDPIFNFIKEHGCCFFSSGMMRQHKINILQYVLQSLKVTRKNQYADILTQVVGFDVENKRAVQLLDRWIEAATKKVPFLEPSADQFSFAILANELNLLHGELSPKYYLEGGPSNFKVKPETIIFHQYDFLNPNSIVPEDIFNYRKKFLIKLYQ